MKKLFFLSIALLGVCFTMTAKTWRVNNADATADFSSLDDAMAGITAGDTLYLEGSPNAYSLSNAITKKVAIIGPGYFLTENPNTLYNKIPATISSSINVLAQGSLFEGIRQSSTTSIYLYIGADDVTVRRCYMENGVRFSDMNNNTQIQINNAIIMQNYINGGGIGNTSTSTDKPYNAIVTNNIIYNYNTPWIGGFSNSVIENNTFGCGSHSWGLFEYDQGCEIKNNIAFSFYTNQNTGSTLSNNYTSGTVDYIPSSGASTDGKYQLADTSGALTAASDGGQCGAFGGATPYILSGLANIPHIYEIDAPSAASSASGLPVTLKIGTEK